MTTNPYQSSSTMNALNAPATYTATEPTLPATYGSAPVTSQPVPESRFDRGFLISIPGILKLISVVSKNVRFGASPRKWFGSDEICLFV